MIYHSTPANVLTLINNYDSNKKTLSITFDLSRESIRQFAVDYEIIKINLKVS